MGEAFDPGAPDARHAEISKLVQEDQIEQAEKRLLDFSRDFAHDTQRRQNDITLNINARKRLDEDERRLGGTEQTRRTRAEVIHRLLELSVAMLEEAKKRRTNQADTHDRASPTTTAATPRIPVPHNDIETARSFFLQRRRGNLTPAPDSDRKPLFRCSKISRTHSSKALTFHLSGISIELHAGEITGLVGLNGSGKSTLLQIIAGRLAIDQGELSYPALADGLAWPEIKNQIAYIPQQPKAWSEGLEDTLAYQASLHGITGQENEEEVDFVLYRLGLERFRRAKWEHLSTATQMRFELARALVWRPRLLVLDEPLGPLDIEAQQLFLHDLWALARSPIRPIGVILSSQHVYEIEVHSDHLLVLSEGAPSYYGPTKALGAERRVNSFEFICSANRDQLTALLNAFPVEQLEQVGPRFAIHVPLTVTGNDILRALLQVEGIQVDYFRNLSRSSRQMLRHEVCE